MNPISPRAPQVSVIIPTYNHRDYVLQTLDSVLAQTFADYEIIVVNDGSPDDSAQVLAPLIKQSQIKHIEQPNAGQAAARNRGLAEAQGEFIAFLDDDDLWPLDKLQWQVAALADDPDLLAIAGDARYFESAAEIKASAPENGGVLRGQLPEQGVSLSVEGLFAGTPIISPGQVLIRAHTLRQVGAMNEGLRGTDDWDLWFRIARAGTIKIVPRLALYYRQHQFNASKNRWAMLENARAVVQEQLPFAGRQSGRLQRRAERYVYTIFAQPMLLEARQSLKSREWRALQTVSKVWLAFARPALKDPILLGRLLNQTLSVRSLWRKLQSHLPARR